MAISSTSFGQPNGNNNTKGQFKKGHNPKWTCPVCEHTTSENHKNQHKCSGPKFEHPDYEDIRAYRNRLWHRANNRGDECLLTAKQIADLLDEAGICIYQLGSSRECYHLARYNDTGNYEWGNCRFIPSVENVSEMKNALAKACIIDGVEYPSRAEAARAIGMSEWTVGNRISRSDWPNYNWKE